MERKEGGKVKQERRSREEKEENITGQGKENSEDIEAEKISVKAKRRAKGIGRKTE
jgi:hypothetical protein